MLSTFNFLIFYYISSYRKDVIKETFAFETDVEMFSDSCFLPFSYMMLDSNYFI